MGCSMRINRRQCKMTVNDYLVYCLKATSDGQELTGTLLEAPGMIVTGKTEEELVKNAKIGILDLAMGYFDVKKPFPAASRKEGPAVYPGYDAALKIAARNLMIKDNVSGYVLAADLKISKQLLSQRLSLHKATKIEAMAEIFRALGYDPAINLTPAA